MLSGKCFSKYYVLFLFPIISKNPILNISASRRARSNQRLPRYEVVLLCKNYAIYTKPMDLIL